MDIIDDDLEGAAVQALLREHLQSMARQSPPESIHALGLEALRAADVSFWSAWEDGELLGCGAMRELSPTHGELKSMRTSSAHLRKGVASKLVVFMIDIARRRGYRRLSLETGSSQDFAPARALYSRYGFETCEPFAHYALDPHSTFMTLELP